MKKTVYLLLISLVTIICVIIGVVWHSWGEFSFGSFGKKDSFEITENSSSFEEFSDIVITADVMDIEIRRGQQFRIYAEFSEKLKPECSIDNGVLDITQRSHSHFWFGNNNFCRMTVTIPEDFSLEKLTAQMDVGDLFISDIICDKLDIYCNVGDMDLVDIVCSEANLTSDVGDIDVERIEFDDMEISCDVGDVDVETAMSIEDYYIELDSDVGDIEYNDRDYKDYYQQGSKGSITITCDVGDISLESGHKNHK